MMIKLNSNESKLKFVADENATYDYWLRSAHT